MHTRQDNAFYCTEMNLGTFEQFDNFFRGLKGKDFQNIFRQDFQLSNS